jgi:hypothetical protein
MNATAAPACNPLPVSGVYARVSVHLTHVPTLHSARKRAASATISAPQGDAALELPSPTVAHGARGAVFDRGHIDVSDREGVGAR